MLPILQWASYEPRATPTRDTAAATTFEHVVGVPKTNERDFVQVIYERPVTEAIILCGHCSIEQLHSMCNSTMQRVYLRPWSNYTYHTNSSSQNELQRRAGVQCNFLRKQRREQEKRFRTRFGHRDDVLPTVPTLY